MINSKSYWEQRFSSKDWEKYSGEEQSRFFAELAVSAFPDWLDKELNENEWSLIDYGCAEGDGSAFLAKTFPNCSVTGIDFSDSAITAGRKKYPYCNYEQGDIVEANLVECDVAFSSNTLEHLRSPLTILKKIILSTRKYSVFLLPFEDTSEHEEHFHIFRAGMFPDEVGNHYLSYFQIIDCRDGMSPYWNGKQILLIYTNQEYSPKQNYFLGSIYQINVSPLIESRHLLRVELANKETKIAEAASTNAELESQVKKQDELIDALNAQTIDLTKEKTELEQKLQDRETKIAEAASTNAELESQVKKQDELIDALNAQTIDLTKEKHREEEHLLTIEAMKKRQQDFAEQVANMCSSLNQVINTCQDLSQTKSFRMAHLLSRVRNQFFRGSKAERKLFCNWMLTRLKKNNTNIDYRYNPIYQIITPLQQLRDITRHEVMEYTQPLPVQNIDTPAMPYIAPEACVMNEAAAMNMSFLDQPYRKYDVIVFSVIDYDFRYQRPQQIADHYARQGHRVFYINANFKADPGIRVTQKENLYKVTLHDAINNAVYSLNDPVECDKLCTQLNQLMAEYGIRDALMIADYPTWVKEISYLKSRYGFPLITDYMDDFTGFVTTCEAFVKGNCIELLKISDAVAASSQYLVDVVTQYNSNVTLIRNGTEFEHFHKAYGISKQKPRKIIGYYGAIAEWFDFGKVEFLARRFPECDIVLIGNITNDAVKKCNLPNIKKLGEMPYADLPRYLCDFDVCLIPFDTSTNLIKATNPVKFYEYLSAGKKIVATEIPELESFRNQFVYLTNDDEQFADYVRMCLEGTDTLADSEQCFQFAKENDWEHRVDVFETVATSLFPKVSIIVLCYNQLEYTRQCVESILKETAYPNYELILVDNCSKDHTAEYLHKMEQVDPRIKIIINTTNRGFAGGNNDGIAVSDGEYIVLLNNDTLVTRGWLTNMVKRFKLSAKTGMVGAVTNSIGNEAQIPVDYQDVEGMPAFAYNYTMNHMGENYPHDGVLAMFCVMFSRKLMNQIGILDENYGVGMFEDDDYSVAAKRAGYKLILPEDVFIHHFGSVSFKKLEDVAYRKLFEKNQSYFEKKWGTKWHMHHYRKN